MWPCSWWRHRFWNLWISQKYKTVDISRTKHYYFSNKKNHQLHIKGYFMAKNSFVAGVTFIGPRPWPEGPYKIGSVCPSFRLFVKFSRNWPISFFLNLAWCYGPIYGCVWQPDFLEKIPVRQKLPKMAQKQGIWTF